MRQAVLALAFLAAGGVTVAAEDDQAKKDLKSLQGTWKLVSQTKNGKETAKDELEGMTLTFKGKKWELKKGDKVHLAGTFELDPSKKPSAADWTVTSEGDRKGQTVKAIYKFEDGKLHHCYGETRPEKFESKEGSKANYVVLERVKE